MRAIMSEYFKEVYGDTEGVRVFFAPGRVNLIGEHTDYNGGHVFPCALTLGTYAAVRIRKDRNLRFFSVNYKEQGVITSSPDELIYHRKDDWANYPKGVLWAFALRSVRIPYGMDIVYWGNLPNSSGLSSSASIEVLTAYIIRELYGIEIDLKELALLGQYAENHFIGVNCGIMDQFAIAMGRKDHAIFLDTAELTYKYAPLALGEYRLVIACSNKKRGLGDSKYNERRSECEEALRRLQTVVRIHSLGELTEEQFEYHKAVIGDDTLTRRAKHAVYENARTIKAVDALKAGDIPAFGKLMEASHISLRDDYEVTGIELDTLAESAWRQEGVIGARMTGAGFGGCTVNIVKETCMERFIHEVGREYEQKIGYQADFYAAEIGNGPSELKD